LERSLLTSATTRAVAEAAALDVGVLDAEGVGFAVVGAGVGFAVVGAGVGLAVVGAGVGLAAVAEGLGVAAGAGLCVAFAQCHEPLWWPWLQ
jgi:hypothetical protein